ncbi:MAG: VCBS repeat-containing protein, partial [Planctomycetota bacterium]
CAVLWGLSCVLLVVGLPGCDSGGHSRSTPPLPDGAHLPAADSSAGAASAVSEDAAAGPPETGSTAPGAPFVERASELGLDFVHYNGMTGALYFCETVGPGVAWFDLEGDGDLDLFVVQGHLLGDHSPEKSVFAAPAGAPIDRLFRNELVETGTLSFTDVTEASGILGSEYGMGVAAADYDADGDVDLYVANFGRNRLWQNQGDGRFLDRTDHAGLQDTRWNTSSAFLDYDRDGDLDLFVGAYVRFTLETHKDCYSPTSARDYCGPLSYPPYPDRLYRNEGDGTFVDVTAPSQIGTAFGSALGVIAADFDRDGWVDIFVANDGLPNQCWLNQGDGTFVDDALLLGCAFNEDGVAEASMGVDAEDFDGDGDIDLFMTHLDSETNTLYVNDGTGQFEDETFETGLGVPSRTYTGFGTAWIDYNHGGWLDLFCANGAVKRIESLARDGDVYPLDQTNQLFRNEGGRRFAEVSVSAGPAFELAEVSRGAAFGDVDNDGDTDVVVANNSGPLRLLINTQVAPSRSKRSRWVGFDVRSTAGGGERSAIGARVALHLASGDVLWRTVRRSA